MNLSSQPLNSSCKIVSVDNPDPTIKRRLQMLGFLPGTEVFIKRRAPLGSPIEFELRGTSICLRSSEASLIMVENLPENQ